MFTNGEINKAGDALISPLASDEQINNALSIINKWRGYHVTPPIHTLQVNLKKKALSIDKNAILAQRLKKISSIKSKLNREQGMKLSRMQDIGGCRAIMQSVNYVYELRNSLVHSRMKHLLTTQKDYIEQPKLSGYRGIHLAYRYMSDKKSDFCGMRVELQIRTKLQHIWATAVETAGIFTNSALKSSKGSDEWLLFFRYMSSLFALEEYCNVVPNTSNNYNELIQKIKQMDEDFKFSAQLSAFNVAIHETILYSGNYSYYILQLKDNQLFVKGYGKNELELANIDYAQAEKSEEQQRINVVLIAVESIEAMRQSYPNYFLDTSDFNRYLSKYINSEV